jgi:hypothetical protein
VPAEFHGTLGLFAHYLWLIPHLSVCNSNSIQSHNGQIGADETRLLISTSLLIENLTTTSHEMKAGVAKSIAALWLWSSCAKPYATKLTTPLNRSTAFTFVPGNSDCLAEQCCPGSTWRSGKGEIMHTPKKICALLSVLAMACAYQLLQPAASQAGPIIWFEIGRPSKDCTGFGICRGGLGRPTARQGGASRAVSASTTLAGEQLTIEFTAPLPEKGNTLTVEQEMTLDAAAAKQLGYTSVTILPGAYSVDYGKGRFGAVTVNAKLRKLDSKPAHDKTTR